MIFKEECIRVELSISRFRPLFISVIYQDGEFIRNISFEIKGEETINDVLKNKISICLIELQTIIENE